MVESCIMSASKKFISIRTRGMISIFVQLVLLISDQRLDLLSKYANSSKPSYLNSGPPHLSGSTETSRSAYITQPITLNEREPTSLTMLDMKSHSMSKICCLRAQLTRAPLAPLSYRAIHMNQHTSLIGGSITHPHFQPTSLPDA